VFCWATWSRSSQLGFSRVSHINCDIVGQPLLVALIKNGRRERLPYKIPDASALAVAVVAVRGYSTKPSVGSISGSRCAALSRTRVNCSSSFFSSSSDNFSKSTS